MRPVPCLVGMPDASASPALRGGGLALAAAVLFGISTPLTQRFADGAGSLWVAALLYAGAAMVSVATVRPSTLEARLQRADAPRLLAMAACGAALAPVLLVWGLARTGAVGASLMLALEAVFTALLARVWYAEAMNRRVLAGMFLLCAGAAILVLDQGRAGEIAGAAGLLAVLGATVAWSLDNALSRGLAERDPAQVVAAKSALGAVATASAAWAAGQSIPHAPVAIALIAVGATGYGLSLRLYLLAQREFGAARTGSVFAFAPFIGAAAAVAMGERGFSAWLVAAAAMMAAGVALHLAERHQHTHTHEVLEHEHAHTHADAHHLHRHDPMPVGAHSHWHRHERIEHTHAHVPDAHHRHPH